MVVYGNYTEVQEFEVESGHKVENAIILLNCVFKGIEMINGTEIRIFQVQTSKTLQST